MIILLLFLIIARPFICSVAFPELNLIYSASSFCFLISWAMIKKTLLWDNKNISIAIAAFITAIAISILSSNNKIVSLLTLGEYINGILLFFICRSLPNDEKNKVILTLILTSVFISLLGINQFFLGFQNLKDYLLTTKISDPIISSIISQERVFTPFITPNTLAGYLIMIIPLALTLKDRAWIVIPLFLTLLLTKSVGAILCLLAASAIFFCAGRKQPKDSTINLLITGLLIGLCTLTIALILIRTSSQFTQFQPDYSIRMRLSYWLQTLLIIKDYLFTGVGLGVFEVVNSRYAHNNFLQIWAETGLLGITSFTFLMIALIKSGLNALEENTDKTVAAGLFCGSLAFFLHNLIDFTFFFPETCFIWCIILGLLLNTSTQTSSSQR